MSHKNILTKVIGVSPDDAMKAVRGLTIKQREVAELMADGHTNEEIAKKLGISRKTLDIHRSVVVMKLGVKPIGVPRYIFAARFANILGSRADFPHGK